MPSVFHTCLDAVNHSRVREDGTKTTLKASERGESGSRISFLEAYWMATVGGGILMPKSAAESIEGACVGSEVYQHTLAPPIKLF